MLDMRTPIWSWPHLIFNKILQIAIFDFKFSHGIPCTKFHWLHACMDREIDYAERERDHQSTTTKRASNPRGCNLGRSRPLSLRERRIKERGWVRQRLLPLKDQPHMSGNLLSVALTPYSIFCTLVLLFENPLCLSTADVVYKSCLLLSCSLGLTGARTKKVFAAVTQLEQDRHHSSVRAAIWSLELCLHLFIVNSELESWELRMKVKTLNKVRQDPGKAEQLKNSWIKFQQT